MLPGLSTVLRRDKERQRAAGGAPDGSPSSMLATSPSAAAPSMSIRRDDSGAGPTSFSSQSPAAPPAGSRRSTQQQQQPSAPAASAQPMSPPQGMRGPGLLPEEHRARERERERLARAQLSNAHTTQVMANRQLQQSLGGGAGASSGIGRVGETANGHQRDDSSTNSRYSSSHMESSVTRLLVATKMLLEALTKWSLGQRTETQVSDIYVRLGNDFNVANVAFGSYGIDMSDLASVPDDLRDCLERCLSEEASPQTLEIHLPRIREIIIGLLQGLKGKQAEYKQLLIHRRASARSSKSRPVERIETVSAIGPATAAANEQAAIADPDALQRNGSGKRAHSPTGALFEDDVRKSVVGRRPMNAPPLKDPSIAQRPGSVASSRQTDSVRAPQRRSRRETGEGQRAMEQADGAFASHTEVGSEEAALGLVSDQSPIRQMTTSRSSGTLNGKRRDQMRESSGMDETAVGEIGDAADPSVRALKSRDALERRASKRFSAYTFNKMGVGLNQGMGMSSYGLQSGTGSGMSSPAMERGSMATPSKSGGSGSVKRNLLRSASTEMQAYDTPTKGPLRDRGALASDAILESDPPQRKKGSRSSPRHSPRPNQSLSLAPPPMPMMREQANSSTDSLPFVDAQSAAKDVVGEEDASGSASDARTSVGSGSGLAAVPPVPPLPTPQEQARLDAARNSKTGSGMRQTSGSHTPTASHHGGPAVSDVPATNMSLFLQLGRQTKKIVVDLDHTLPFKGMSTGKFRMLFMDKFTYSPGKEDFPTIYVKDVHSGVTYELEDLNEIADGTVLTLNIEPLDQVKQHLDLTLGGITREIRDLKTTIQERDREWNRRMSFQPSDGLAPPLSPQSRISDAQFAMAGARVAKYKRATMVFGRENEAEGGSSVDPLDATTSDAVKGAATRDSAQPISPTSQRPKSVGGWQLAGDQLKKQYEEVLNVRRQLAVMGQIHEDFKGDVGGLLEGLREQAKRVRTIAANDVPTERNFIIAGKARLDSNSQEVLTLVEDLLDLVDDLKADVIQRGVKPKPHTMKKLGEDIDRATRGLEDLTKYVELVKPSWKKTWEMELQNIVDEQEFLNHQEGLIADLKEDHANLQDVFHNIQEVVKLRGANKFNLLGAGGGGETGLSNVSLRTYIPPAPEDGHGGLPTVMMDIKSQRVNHEKRLKALEAAEKQRLKELHQRKLQEDEFQNELTTFVDGKVLRKTGGYLETERVRGRRDKLTLHAMFGAGGVGGAPPDVGPLSTQKLALSGGHSDRIAEEDEGEEDDEEEEEDDDDEDGEEYEDGEEQEADGLH